MNIPNAYSPPSLFLAYLTSTHPPPLPTTTPWRPSWVAATHKPTLPSWFTSTTTDRYSGIGGNIPLSQIDIIEAKSSNKKNGDFYSESKNGNHISSDWEDQQPHRRQAGNSIVGSSSSVRFEPARKPLLSIRIHDPDKKRPPVEALFEDEEDDEAIVVEARRRRQKKKERLQQQQQYNSDSRRNNWWSV